MRNRHQSAVADRDRFRAPARRLDEILQRLVSAVRAHRQRLRYVVMHRHRLEARSRVRHVATRHRVMGDHRGQHHVRQRVAVGLRSQQLHQAHLRGGARLVDDDDRRHQLLLEPDGHQPRAGVGDAAGRVRHDDRDRFAPRRERGGLRERRGAPGAERDAGDRRERRDPAGAIHRIAFPPSAAGGPGPRDLVARTNDAVFRRRVQQV